MKPEEAIQRQIVQYLALMGIFFFSVPNENAGGGKGAMIRMQKYRAMGLRPGVSDLVVLLPSRIVFIEVKTATGRQSENQKRFEALVTSLGFEYYVVRSVDDVSNVL
jgi:hypothetical protein